MLSFTEHPPLTRQPSNISLPREPQKRTALRSAVQQLLRMDVVETVPDPDSPGFYSHLFLVPKKDGRWRPILDLSILNLHLHSQRFKMETAETIRQDLKHGEWATSIDFTEAYHHVPIHPRCRRYLRFKIDDIQYQYRCLPMGLSSSPERFTRVSAPMKAFAHHQGVHVHMYLDDWLIHSPHKRLVQEQTVWLVNLVEALGWLINFEKSELVPTQNIDFLGYQLNFLEGKVFPTGARWEKIQAWIPPFLQRASLPAIKWQELIGLLTSTEKMVPLGRLHMRELQWNLASQWNQLTDSQNQEVIVTPETAQALRWWLNRDNVLRGITFVQPLPHLTIYVDASNLGWGGYLGSVSAMGTWSAEEKSFHINVKEMLGAWNVLKELEHLLRGRRVLIASDNSTVVCYINKQGGLHSRQLCRLVMDMILWAQERNMSLSCKHIPGRLNVLADKLSRKGQIIPTEWTLSQRVFDSLWVKWERPHVDLFATRHNNKLPTFVSPVPDEKAWEVDALSLNWSGLIAYAFPPTVILSQVLRKIRDEECVVFLVAPLWPNQQWYPLLQELLTEPPLELPLHSDLLSQPLSRELHRQPELLRLHVFRLSGKPKH